MYREPAVTTYPALFRTETDTCKNCSPREIFWHATGRVWLHADSRITVCDEFSSTPTKAVPTSKEN